jgi:hypothetical protein
VPGEIPPGEEAGSPEPPTRARQWAVFAGTVAGVGILLALVFFAMSLPPCETPPNSWAPCIGP